MPNVENPNTTSEEYTREGFNDAIKGAAEKRDVLDEAIENQGKYTPGSPEEADYATARDEAINLHDQAWDEATIENAALDAKSEGQDVEAAKAEARRKIAQVDEQITTTRNAETSHTAQIEYQEATNKTRRTGELSDQNIAEGKYPAANAEFQQNQRIDAGKAQIRQEDAKDHEMVYAEVDRLKTHGEEVKPRTGFLARLTGLFEKK